MPATDAAPPGPRTERGAAGAACDHCGLPVPAGLIERGEALQFCCGGCRTAWGILHESGLDQYYRLPERRTAAVRPTGRSFEEFDHSAFHQLYVRSDAAGLAEADLYLEGIHCASCVWLVERVPRTLPGLVSAELNVPRSLVRVRWDPRRVRLSEVARFLDRLGYRPHPFRGVRPEAVRRAEDRSMIARIGVAGAIAGNVMLLALALYAGWFTGMEPEFERTFRWISLALTTPAVFGPGWLFFRGAWAALRTRTLHMDLPIALALGAGYVRGAVNALGSAHGPIYFDGVTLLIFLLLVGRFLQQRAQRAATDSAELMASLAPATARVRAGGAVKEVPVEALLPGMVLEVRPGDTLAADGTVLEGRSELDLALLTGESRPVAVGPGERVYAGTLNRRSTLEVTVEEAGETTRLGRILQEVEAAALRRAPIVRLADRLAGGFVAAVLVLALLTGLAWLFIDRSRALDNAIALLIVTCPCALGLATPLAVTVAIGRAARAGILVKGGDALEALGRPGRLVLDKTGTVTEGRTTLVTWEGPEEVKPLVAALERHSVHPLAAGFAAAWPGLPRREATGVAHTIGGGVEGEVGGRRVVVGSPDFVRARAPGGPAGEPPGDPSLTPVLVAVDGVVVAHAAFGDPVRADAAAALAALRARGWRPELLSGDDPRVVRAVGEALGIPAAACRGGAGPEEKLRFVEQAMLEGPVVMVGDGVNDAAAISRATAGVGMHGGAEACLSSADVFLSRPGLAGLVTLSAGAARTLRVIRRNIAFSLAYNLAGAALAMTGVINPLIAAVLMPASSLTVILASWLSRTFEADRT
jgi:P-type Cu2+ transporter